MTLLPILLPEGFEVKVSAGKNVTAGSVLAEGQGEHHEEIIHLSKELKLSPQKAIKTLKKNLGDSIVSEEVLAEKKSLLGSQKIISNFSGIITKIDEQSADLTIRVGQKETNRKAIISPVDGIIDSCDNQKIVIKTDKLAFLANDAIGGEAEGEILYIPDFNETKLNKDIEDKVLLAQNINKIALFKAIGLDAGGIITQNLEGVDFVDLQEKDVRLPIMETSEEDFKKIAKYQGKRVYLFGKNKSIIVL